MHNSTGRRNKTKRDISFLSKVLGDGTEILKIETTLSSAIENFNKNFRKVELFDDQVKDSISLLDDEIFGLMKNLVPINKYLISCAAVSQYKVSVWHNILVTKTSQDTFLIGSDLVAGTQLKNKSAANMEVRSFLQKELLLGVFNIFGTTLQCLQAVQFVLNGQQLTWRSLTYLTNMNWSSITGNLLIID